MEFQLPVLAPSILAADFTRLGEEIEQCLEADIDWIHCDIMDGHFVPNISYGPGIVAAARSIAPEAFFDVHLMIENPDQYIEDFMDAGSDLISVHYEACPHLHRTLQNIREHGCMNGVVINPGTAVENIVPVLDTVDLVLIMSVNPGFGGQKFIESSYRKVQKLVQIRQDILVSGSGIFKADDIPERIKKMRERANLGRKDLV